MSVWLTYRHIDADDDNLADVSYDNFQYVKFGALINF